MMTYERRPADVELVDLVHSFNANFVIINFLFQSVAIDAQHLSGFYLVAIVGAQSDFQQRSFDLFQNNIVQTVQFNLSFFLLLEQNLQLALNKLLEAHSLKISDEKIV